MHFRCVRSCVSVFAADDGSRTVNVLQSRTIYEETKAFTDRIGHLHRNVDFILSVVGLSRLTQLMNTPGRGIR